ncbi:hypothetical protein GCM10025877_12630 [Agromyces mangrovi Wang et al. 2018]|nr:hypothetical protein GCM10025877_12630 [Agromyces mangrovi]
MTQVAAGEMHILARRQDGIVVGWGASPVRHTVPHGLNDVSVISAGNDHSLALRNDGSVVAWGKNAYQQLHGPSGSTVEFVGWEGDGYYLRSLNSRIDPYERQYGPRQPGRAAGTGFQLDAEFERFVISRLGHQPRPIGAETSSPRYVAGAGEVLLDILVLANDTSGRDAASSKLERDIANGDPIAPMAKHLVLMWASRVSAGTETSVSELVTEELTPLVVPAYRSLIRLFAGTASADRLATLKATLARRSVGVDPLPGVLQDMLESAERERSSPAAHTDRPGASALRSNARQTAQPAQPTRTSQGGCFVATAVYGSYDCPEVRVLRRYRDGQLARHRAGRLFIQLYYKVSPALVRVLGDEGWFVRSVRPVLDLLVARLRQSGLESGPYADQ